MSIDVTGIGAVATLVDDTINKIWPNKTEEEKQQLAAAMLVIQGQIDTNKAEATNPNLFVAGWRPAVGWVCAIGLGTQFLIGPMATWIAALMNHPIVFPSLDMETLFTLLFGMLGLTAARTVEKVNGINSGH